MCSHSVYALLFDCVFETKTLVLSTLENERCGNRRLVLKGDREVLGCIDFGKSNINYWLFEVHNRPTELSLAREANWCSVLDLNEEVGDGWADLTAAHHNLEVNRIILADLSHEHGSISLVE